MSVGALSYNHRFFTGTATNPDTLSIFIKGGKDDRRSFQVYHSLALSNWLGFMPVVGSFTGVARIGTAVKEIFRRTDDSSEPKNYWNAFKNLFRGFVEFLPLTGLGLIIYDSVRIAVWHSGIEKALKDEENVVGVAIDGKVICTIPISHLEVIFKENPTMNSDADRFLITRTLFFKFLEKKEEEKKEKEKAEETLPQLTMPQVFEKLKTNLRVATEKAAASSLADIA